VAKETGGIILVKDDVREVVTAIRYRSNQRLNRTSSGPLQQCRYSIYRLLNPIAGGSDTFSRLSSSKLTAEAMVTSSALARRTWLW
jgi:hypothetical protein